ncbi:MAG TPA: hypothetical protein VFK06_15695 [Candidatus Angelobacter sp.]|nr:hypothetical protein [Candidatus Angelobacter sp.]
MNFSTINWIVAIRRLLIVLVFVAAGLAGFAPAAGAQVTVGGHVGFVVPWVTHADGQTTTQFDQYNLGFPIGVTFKGQGHFAVDFEMIPFVSQKPHETTLVVDPGVLYSLNHGVTVGMRAAFSVNSSQTGFIPLVNKSWKFKNQSGFFKAYFVEADLPVQFSRPTGGPATNSVTFATHFGLGF